MGIPECEHGTCEHVQGQVTHLEYILECGTRGCPERSFGFVARRPDEPCRKCGEPTVAKHSFVVNKKGDSDENVCISCVRYPRRRFGAANW